MLECSRKNEEKSTENYGRGAWPLARQSFEEPEENYHLVCGTPDAVLEKLKYLHDRLGFEHLIMYGQESRVSHEATMANIGLFGKEVLPVIRDWWPAADIMPVEGLLYDHKHRLRKL